jgi:hypothetical protein
LPAQSITPNPLLRGPDKSKHGLGQEASCTLFRRRRSGVFAQTRIKPEPSRGGSRIFPGGANIFRWGHDVIYTPRTTLAREAPIICWTIWASGCPFEGQNLQRSEQKVAFEGAKRQKVRKTVLDQRKRIGHHFAACFALVVALFFVGKLRCLIILALWPPSKFTVIFTSKCSASPAVSSSGHSTS